jgi:TetR/AcrR family transcriptional repressor of nem operon
MHATHPTKQRLLDAGLAMLLEHGYNDLGIQALLAATGTPKGSFYHHFKDKEDFALQVIDQYMRYVHAGLEACLGDRGRPPLQRVRRFFELTRRNYRREGYMGCLLGGLGQELSGVSEVFRRRIEGCFGNRRSSRRLPGRGPDTRRHPDRCQCASHGQLAGRLLGGRSASQPAARQCRATDRDARLLLPVGSRSLTSCRDPLRTLTRAIPKFRPRPA